MARQLAVSTVIAWFGNLSFDQQKDALGRMQGQHDQSRSAKRAELETQLAALGLRRSEEARSASRQDKWKRQWRGVEESSQGQSESQVPGSEDKRDLVRARSHGELAEEQAGRRREDREVSRLTGLLRLQDNAPREQDAGRFRYGFGSPLDAGAATPLTANDFVALLQSACGSPVCSPIARPLR